MQCVTSTEMATIDGNTRVFQWKFVKLMCYICEKHLIYYFYFLIENAANVASHVANASHGELGVVLLLLLLVIVLLVKTKP